MYIPSLSLYKKTVTYLMYSHGSKLGSLAYSKVPSEKNHSPGDEPACNLDLTSVSIWVVAGFWCPLETQNVEDSS